MILITSQEQFAKYVPNILKAVQGEASVYEKAAASLERSELWLVNTFIPIDMLDNLPEKTKDIAAHIVALDAFYDIAPSIDLVLTPNGFGIVNNTNVIPASKERIDRLRASLIADRDKYVDLLLHELSAMEGWRTSIRGAAFRSTLFPNLEICNKVLSTDIRFRGGVWEKYLYLTDIILKIEVELEMAYFSPQMMEVFRREVQAAAYSNDKHRKVISLICSYIFAVLSGEQKPKNLLDDAIDIIRKDEEAFPEWHASAVKELFSPVAFENRKEYGGYFF